MLSEVACVVNYWSSSSSSSDDSWDAFSSFSCRGGKKQKKEGGLLSYALTTPTRKMPKAPSVFNNNSCLWFMPQRDCFYFNNPQAPTRKRLNVIIKSLINHCGMKNTQGKSEPSVVKNDSYTQQWVTMRHPAFCPLAFPAHTYCCPRCPFIKMRSLVRRVTVGHSFLWLMQFRRVRPNHSCTWHNVTTRPQFLLD